MSQEQALLAAFAGISVVFLLYNYFSASSSVASSGSTPPIQTPGGGVDISGLIGFSQLVKDIASAIGVAEGYGEDPNNIPTRANNPGDLTDVGQNFPGDTGQRVGANIIVFDKPSSGFNALYHQINLWLTGESNVIGPNDTIETVGMKYAPLDPLTWAANVSGQLSAMGYNAGVNVPLNQLQKAG